MVDEKHDQTVLDKAAHACGDAAAAGIELCCAKSWLSCTKMGEPCGKIFISTLLCASFMNVLLISVDSLRFDRVGCLYKNKETLTPHTDALGLNGARFLNNFTVSNGSLPSHTSVFTGLYPQHHGIRENGLQVPQHLITLASTLKTKGYATAACAGSVLLDSIYGLNKGFDTYYNTSRFSRMHHLLSKVGYKKYNVSK